MYCISSKMKQTSNSPGTVEGGECLENILISTWSTIWRYKIVIVFLILLYFVHYTFYNKIKGADEQLLLNACITGTKYVEDNFQDLDQFNQELIRYVRTRYLIPPTKENIPYNFNHPEKDIRTGHGQWVRKFLKDKRNGVFIEAGANEGEFHSHTLELEKELGWSGLLIECNPTVTPYLRTKKRKAWVAGVCIAMGVKPAVLNFSNPESWTYSGRLGPAWNLPVKTNWTYFDVESVPLYTIIAAAGYDTIDFFSFDVEGIEFDILKHFPFDKITIKLIIMEVQFISQEKRDELEKFMHSKGFITVEKQALDHIYRHKTLIVD